jgi:2-hydroxychromene-2-carboxylate isomerase
MSDALTVYFSLRSPYSWLALHRLERLGARLAVPMRLVPVYPRDGSNAPDPATNHARFRYLVEDASRIAQAYGLRMRPPVSLDCRWELPHAAFTFADDQGRGLAFAREAATARFTRAADLGSLEVLGEIASIVGLPPDAVVAAAQDPGRHARIEAGITAAGQAGVIGVPYFVYKGHRFWGNDRLDWLLREIDRDAGRPVTDLERDACFAPPWSPDGA